MEYTIRFVDSPGPPCVRILTCPNDWNAFFNYRFGSAAAQSVVLFLIVLVLTLVMFKIEKKGVKY